MLSKLRYFLFLSALCFSFPFMSAADNDQDPTCMLMLESFANLTATYTYCTISHARPITLCQMCVSPYLKVLDVYDDITEIESAGGQKCESELANLDRLQVFKCGFNYVTELWIRAFCDKCFVPNEKTNRPTPRLTDTIQEILNASAIHKSCIAKYRNASISPDLATCELCLDSYTRINDVYNVYKVESGGNEFCMDIVDLINDTRSQWSDSIGCSRFRWRTEVAYLMSSLAIGSLPVLFYLMAYTVSSKKQHAAIEDRRKKWNGASVSERPSVGESAPVS